MIIKRYLGSTTQEAMNQVKTDLGSNAIILNTRHIRKKGLLGWFTKPLIEVTAAIDEDVGSSAKRKKSIPLKNKEALPNVDSLAHIEKKVDTMGEMIQRLVMEYGQDSTISRSNNYQKNQVYYDALIRNEVYREYAEDIMERAMKLQDNYGKDFRSSFEQIILDCLGKDIRPIEIQPGHRKVILFVGPTGVGKTTTLAKLAAGFTIEQEKKVGFITADTYRIAAVDQLRIYAEILEIPMSVIYSPSQITKALDEHNDRDIVLIDTAGRSIKDKNHEEEIIGIITMGNIDEIFLVISGNTSPQGCINIINNYKFLPKYKLIFTKIDEITTYGSILNCRILSHSPLSYITTGQNVPADIELADTNKIKDLLIGNIGL